jgi:hypothetical protein
VQITLWHYSTSEENIRILILFKQPRDFILTRMNAAQEMSSIQ